MPGWNSPGDANMVAEFSMWNFRGKAFWEKYLDDIETTRNLHDGLPCNTAPGRRTCGTAEPDWAAAFIMLPWYLYVHYGDRAVLVKHWDGMRRLMEYFGERAGGWVLEGGFGDWFDPGDKSICTHTAPALTTTIWFHRCAFVMARAAALLEKHEDAKRHEGWCGQIRRALVDRFYRRETGSFGSQTADAMILHFALAPRGEETRILDSLVRDIRDRNTHMNVGIMGVRFLFEVLTRRGHGALALALMHQDTYPGFGDLIRRGATTLWECWGEAKHDQVHGARSLNHPMMCGFDNWFYNTLSGIRPDPEYPGFRRFFLEPHPVPGLAWVNSHHDCPHGRIVSDWKCDDELFIWDIQVPQGCMATVTMPFSRGVQVLQPGSHLVMDRLGRDMVHNEPRNACR